jgi:hypothetical protein
LHGNAALVPGTEVTASAWRTAICSPVTTLARYRGSEIGVRPDGTAVDDVPRALFETGPEAAGSFKH